MHNRLLGIFFCITLFASCASFVHTSSHASADMICYTVSQPPPAGVYGLTVPPCTAITAAPTAGPTAVPGPTDANGIPLVHPTAVGTLSVNCVSGCAAGSTPIPFATNASGQLIVAPTALPTQTIQGCTGCVAVPVSIATSLAIIPAQVNACNVGFTACSNVGTTVADGYSDLLESIFSTGFSYSFNGASWDRTRNAGVGNAVPATGLQIGSSYCENLTALPTLTTGTYGAVQCDTSGRLLVSPTGLPTPIPVPTSASLYPKTVQCDPTTAANCAIVSSSGVTDSAVCTPGAVCATVGAPADATANANNMLWSNAFGSVFNGTTWDRARSAGVGNAAASTGLAAHASYGEYLTSLPTLTTGTYGAVQLDSSGRQLISPTGLPTPLATQPVSGTVTASSGGCNNQGLANTKVATVSSGGTAGFYQIVPLAAGQTVTICQVTLSGSATASGMAAIVGGTGTNCAVTATNNTGSLNIGTVPSTFSFGTGLGPVTTPFTVSNEVCLDAVGTAPTMTLLVVYEQH
jgi:hypothetical protein